MLRAELIGVAVVRRFYQLLLDSARTTDVFSILQLSIGGFDGLFVIHLLLIGLLVAAIPSKRS